MGRLETEGGKRFQVGVTGPCKRMWTRNEGAVFAPLCAFEGSFNVQNKPKHPSIPSEEHPNLGPTLSPCTMHAQSCLTYCHSMYYNPPGSSVHGIFQVRILDWIAITYSRGSSLPRDQTCISCISCIDRQFLYHCAS